jgi:hypothetical protein
MQHNDAILEAEFMTLGAPAAILLIFLQGDKLVVP